MSDTVQARESAIDAETQIEQIFNKALERLHTLNHSLITMHDAIRASQPVASGSVCLELYRCGTGCTGCPHHRWMKYTWPVSTNGKQPILRGINLDAKKIDPILSLSRKEDHYPITSKLIRETKAILDERKNLLARIRPLRY